MEIKLNSLIGKAKYSLQYIDDDKAWTVPAELTSDRIDKFCEDLSVSKVKILFHVPTLVGNNLMVKQLELSML